ncbi:Signal peptidase complex [Aspergillus sclerotialis]|uniref:Signal peptidase complex subunit 2 n=1 Tax=Aspergillus sclerotialis TaxID=2070753 RepID=A0A3A2ZBN8_9EURO|nr:Signal peptidase complex [Aspergillus sclerotialis]
MASNQAQKVPVYSGNDLKTTTDDSLAPHLTTLPAPYTFTQDHSKTNIRFLLGYTAVAIAAFTFYADRKLGWEATQSPWIIAAVTAYFVLNSLLTIWVWGVEKGEVFRGKTAKGDVLSIRSSVKKYTPLYKIHVRYTDASGKVLQEKDAETSFTTWFSGDGTFHPEPFRRWLASEVEVLKLAAKENEEKTGGASATVGIEEGEKSGVRRK